MDDEFDIYEDLGLDSVGGTGSAFGLVVEEEVPMVATAPVKEKKKKKDPNADGMLAIGIGSKQVRTALHLHHTAPPQYHATSLPL